jgi:hypothetical protein
VHTAPVRRLTQTLKVFSHPIALTTGGTRRTDEPKAGNNLKQIAEFQRILPDTCLDPRKRVYFAGNPATLVF